MADSVHEAIQRISMAHTHLERFVHFVRTLPDGLVKDRLVEVVKNQSSYENKKTLCLSWLYLT